MPGNRCETCAKFVGLETQEPELEDSSFNGTEASFTVRLVRVCAECATEMKEATLDITVDCAEAMAAHEKEKHDGESNSERFEVADEELELIEEGGNRYKASLFGASAAFDLVCSQCNEVVDHLSGSETIEASAMEELA